MKYAGKTTFRTLQQFAYDELNQLIRADDLLRNRTEVYTYDAGGNILSVTTYPLTWGSLSGITSTGTISYGYTDANWKDKLTSYNGQAISYDAIGNPLSWRGYTLAWQNGRQLTSLNGNGTTASYTYDTDGLRTSKTVNGVKHEYYYIGDRLQYEKYGNTQLWFFYDSDGTPSGLRRKDASGTNDYYFLCNWRGDVSRIFDSTGGLIGSYEYDAWGNVQCFDGQGNALTDETDIVVVNPIRYRGYYYDAETGLYYLQSRYYDPQVKRFLNADGIIGANEDILGENVFAYCSNNPVIRMDPTGTEAISALLFGGLAAELLATAAVVLVFLAIVSVLSSPGSQSAIRDAINQICSWITSTIAEAEFRAKRHVAEAEISRKVRRNSNTRYWAAELVSGPNNKSGGYIVLHKALNRDQAIQHVRNGGNVFTVTRWEAKDIAIHSGGQINRHTAGNKHLYDHYHSGKPHIWYIF